MIRIDLTVATVAELATVHVASLKEGANSWVDAEGEYFTLELNSGATPGVNVVAPLVGSPIAGAANARWIRQTGGGGTGSVLFGLLVNRPTAAASNAGFIYYAIDTKETFLSTQTDVASFQWDLLWPVSIRVASFASLSTPTIDLLGQTAIALDNGAIYQVQFISGVFVWNLFVPTQALQGTTASRPVATAALVGCQYTAQDQGIVYVNSQTAPNVYTWVPVNTTAGTNWLAQTAWFIDPTLGLDTNNGNASTQGAGNIGPIQTLTEFFRRVAGPSSVINVAMVVQLLGNTPSTDRPRATIEAPGPSGSLTIKGVGATTLYTSAGGFTAVTNLTTGSNIPPAVTDSALPSQWTPFIAPGIRIRTTGGSHTGAIAWPSKDLTGKQARVSNWNVPNVAGGPFGQSAVNVSIADPFVIEQITKIDNISLSVNFIGGSTVIVFQDIEFVSNVFKSSDINNGQFQFYGCAFAAGSGPPTISAGLMAAVNSQFAGITCFGGSGIFVLTGVALGQTNIGSGLIDLAFMVQGGTGLFVAQGQAPLIGDVGVFDSTIHGIEIAPGGTPYFEPILAGTHVFGSGNTKFGLRVRGGTVLGAVGVPTGYTITGTSGDVGIGGSTGTAKAWGTIPFIQSDIAAGTGTTLSGVVSSGT